MKKPVINTAVPRSMHAGMLAEMLDEMRSTPAMVAKHLRVSERTVFRWLAENSAPFPVLAALWYETPTGRYSTEVDYGNGLMYERSLSSSLKAGLDKERAQFLRLLSIADFGCANDPFLSVQHGPLRKDFAQFSYQFDSCSRNVGVG